jgi:hypothetical protein
VAVCNGKAVTPCTSDVRANAADVQDVQQLSSNQARQLQLAVDDDDILQSCCVLQSIHD